MMQTETVKFFAVLLTGYLGGAVASHVRVSSPLFTHTLFPIYIAIFIWLSLYLRNSEIYFQQLQVKNP